MIRFVLARKLYRKQQLDGDKVKAVILIKTLLINSKNRLLGRSNNFKLAFTSS